jgi:rhamnulokinase
VLCTGSWFILGRHLPEPRTDAACLARGVANEIAALGSTFFARNLMGFFLLEELMRQWRLSDPELSWDELFREAAAAPAFSLSVDPDDPQFFSPANAARSLAEHLERTGQALRPQSRGAVARAVLEGLVISCRQALREIEELTGEPVQGIAVVGGGARNPLLCRMLADGLERPVAVGPAEATVLGNIALQMMGSGELSSQGEVFHLLARGCRREVHEPSCSGPWQERAERRKA